MPTFAPIARLETEVKDEACEEECEACEGEEVKKEEEVFERKLVDSLLDGKIRITACGAESSRYFMGFPSDSRNLSTPIWQQSPVSTPLK